MRQLRSRKPPGALTVTAFNVTEASSTESRENAQPVQSVVESEEQIGGTVEPRSASQKRRNRKKKKQANNMKKCVKGVDGDLETLNLPSAVNMHMEESFKASHAPLSPISLNQVIDLQESKVSKKTPEKLKMNANAIHSDDEQSSICKQQNKTSVPNGEILDPEKTPGPDGSSVESPELSNAKETMESTLHPVVWSNPAFCSETLSEQKSCNTGSTCSPGRLSSVGYCSKLDSLNMSLASIFDSDFEARIEEPLLENSIEQKRKLGICTADSQVKSCKVSPNCNKHSPSLSSNVTTVESGGRHAQYEIEKSTRKGGDGQEGESVGNSCNDHNAFQFPGLQKSLLDAREFEVSTKPTAGQLHLSVSSPSKSNVKNGKVQFRSPLTNHVSEIRKNPKSVEVRSPMGHSKCSEIESSKCLEIKSQTENRKQEMSMKTVHLCDRLPEVSVEHRVQNQSSPTKIKAGQEDEFERGLEEEIKKEIAVLTNRLADIHARREARKLNQGHGKDAMSCPGTPVLAAKLLPQQNTPHTVEQSTNAVDKSRNCKGRVVSAKFLECHSKQQVGKTPTSVDRKLNVHAHASLIPGSSRTKPQRRGVSLGGFGVVAKKEYADSYVRLSDNNTTHFSYASDKKELQQDFITPAKNAVEGLAAEIKCQAKTLDKEKDHGGMSRKRAADASLKHETGLTTGKLCTTNSLRSDVANSHGKLLTPITKEQVAENILFSKKGTPEVRRSRIFPKSMAKTQFETEDVKGTDKVAIEFGDAQLLATLRESRAFRRSPVTKRQLDTDDVKGMEKAATEFPEAQLLAALRENRAFRKSPVTGKVKTVPSRYGESPKQSTPPIRSKPSDQAEKNPLTSDMKRSCSDKRLSLIKGSEKYPALTISPSKPLYARNYVSPFKAESMAFKRAGKCTQKAQKCQDKRSSLDFWKRSSVEKKHNSNQGETENFSSKEVPLADKTHSIGNTTESALLAKGEMPEKASNSVD